MFLTPIKLNIQQPTCHHLQLGHQLLVTAEGPPVRVVEPQQAEPPVRQQVVALGVLVGLVAALPGHQNLPVTVSPDYIRAVGAPALQTDVVVLRD